MRIIQSLLLMITMLSISQVSIAQLNPIKKFDYSLLEGKKLLIPTYEVSESYVKKKAKKGKYDDINETKAEIEAYNKAWEEAMAESSYDATDYEIRNYDEKKLIKEKNKEAILMSYYTDKYGNRAIFLIVTAPKKRLIAYAPINGLDLSEKNDIRLMINMLNESLNTAADLEEEGDKSMKAIKNKYKQEFLTFMEEIDSKTFLVPKSEHKNEKKAKERTADLSEALKLWKLSEKLLTTNAEIENKRLEGDPDSYYWLDIPFYTGTPLTYHMNFIISTENDNVLFGFLGKKRLSPAALESIEKKMVNKAETYKKQLNK